jgi:hypothetical protein
LIPDPDIFRAAKMLIDRHGADPAQRRQAIDLGHVPPNRSR